MTSGKLPPPRRLTGDALLERTRIERAAVRGFDIEVKTADKPVTVATIRRRVAQKVRRLTPEEARAAIEAARTTPNHGITRQITGGYWSQSLDGLVMRKLGVRAGFIKNPR